MKLTWGEFKKFVDDEITTAGLDDTIDIGFMDITPYQDDAVSVDALLYGLEIITYKED